MESSNIFQIQKKKKISQLCVYKYRCSNEFIDHDIDMNSTLLTTQQELETILSWHPWIEELVLQLLKWQADP